MSMATGKLQDDFEHGKYEILTANEISQYLENKYTIFLYNVFGMEYSKGDKLKYRTLILREH